MSVSISRILSDAGIIMAALISNYRVQKLYPKLSR